MKKRVLKSEHGDTTGTEDEDSPGDNIDEQETVPDEALPEDTDMTETGRDGEEVVVVDAGEDEGAEEWSDEDGEEWGPTNSELTAAPITAHYDPAKDQDLHLLAMQYLGYIAMIGIIMGGLLWASKGDLPDFIGVVVGSAVTAIAALFSKK